MRLSALLPIIFTALVLLRCASLPPDPATLPENASIKVITIDIDSLLKEPVRVREQTAIRVTFQLRLPEFIDSVTIEIQSAKGEIEYYTSVEKPWDTTTFAVTLQFPSSGTKSLVYTVWKNNGTEMTETVIFDVAARFTNASPVLIPETIELLSQNGVPTTRNLMPYVTDPDNDKIVFEVKGQDSVLQFIQKDSLLSSISELEDGNYELSIVVSDGILSDEGTILWKVYTPPDGSTEIEDDEVATVRNIPVLINVLENDDLPSGSLLSYAAQGKNGKTILSDGKVRYIPNAGFTGEDTLLYIVNGEDTGWVYVTVAEPEIENRPPVWKPDTIELYSPEGVVSSADVAPYATDPDNDAMVFEVTIPDDAAFEVNNSVIASMGEMEEGTYYLLVAVSDGEESTAGVIEWTVFKEQDVEISAVDDSAALEEGGSAVISVLDNDEGASEVEGILVTSVSQGLHGSTTIHDGTTVLYTPESGFVGSDTVIYVVNGTDTGKVIITVADREPNTAPEWSADSVDKSSITGIAASLNLEPYASDSDDDELTFSIASAPETGFSLQEGTQLTVDAEVDEGEYSIIVTVADGVASAEMTIIWTVYPPSEAELEINDDEAEVVAGNSVTVDVLANDEVVSGEAQLVVTATNDPAHGSVSITDEGIVYSSDVNYEGEDSFTYIVNGTDTGTVTVTIGSAEVTIVEDLHSLVENGSITINVLANDVAPDGLVLKVESVIQGTLGSALVVDDSTVGYEANTDASGTDTVWYVLSNGDTGLVVLTIAAIEYNLTDDVTSVLRGHTREIMVLANDEVNIGTLTVTGVTEASKGSVSFTGSSVLYTADDDGEGSDELTYTVNDGKATAKLTVTLLSIEITPNDDSLVIDEDAEAQTIAVLENDVITEGETMTLTAVSEAHLGTVVIDETNENLIYTPFGDSSGTELITYTINDAINGTMKVVINPVADAPVFTATTDNPTVAEGTTDTIIFTAIDADGTPVVFSLIGAPDWVTLSGGDNRAEVIFAPDNSVATSDDSTATFTLVGVSDGDSITADISVTVTNVNTAPVFANPTDTITLAIGETKTTQFTAADADGDVLTYSLTDTTGFGTEEIVLNQLNDTAQLVLSPANPGSYGVTLLVSDGELFDTAAITLVVQIHDSVGPVITLVSHTNNDTVTTSAITLRVAVQDSSGLSVVTIDGDTVSATTDTCEKQITLSQEGANTISVKGVDNSYSGNSTTQTFTLYLNSPPVASQLDTILTEEDETTPSNINLGGSDSPGSELTWSILETPKKGELSSVTGTIVSGIELTYLLKPDSSGIDSLVYAVSDGTSESDPVTVYINVAPVNDAPVVEKYPNDKTVNEDDSTSLTISEFEVTDKEGDDVVIYLQAGSNYRIANNNSTAVRIVPGTDYNGELQIPVRLHDGKDSTAMHSFTLTVTPRPDDPMIDINVNQTTIPFGDPIPVAVTYSDPDAAGLTSAKLYLDGVEYDDIGQSPATINVTIPYGPQALGSHKIKAIAEDDRGVTAADSVAVTIVESFATDSVHLSAVLSVNGIPVADVRDYCTVSGNRITEVNLSKVVTALPPEIGNLTALTKLVLSNNGLTSLPDTIWTLESLTSLNLYNNKLSSIPAGIGKLQNLTQLSCGANPITALPTALFSITGMKEMYLHSTNLASLPSAIGNLKNLTHLNISNTKLTTLPAAFVNLASLTQLSYNSIRPATIPEEIWALTGLTDLSIQYNNLDAIPTKLLNLTNLTDLNISNNDLTTVPAGLANLTKLEFLNLYGNELETVPSVITSMTSLTELHVNGNNLTTLPSSIGNLTNLDILAVDRNQLTSVPSALQNLSVLRVLDLSDNQLSSLPDGIETLTTVKILYLEGNNLTKGSPAHAWEDWATARDSDWAETQE